MAKRSVKKMRAFRTVLNGACDWLSPHLRRSWYFERARMRKAHPPGSPGYMSMIASWGAKTANAKRAAAKGSQQ